MGINNLSDVQRKKEFLIAKDQYKHYRDGLKDMTERVNDTSVYHRYAAKSLEILENAGAGGSVDFKHTFILTSTICLIINKWDNSIQDWAKGEGNDIDVRLCMYYRKYFVYWLFELSNYQIEIIYGKLNK